VFVMYLYVLNYTPVGLLTAQLLNINYELFFSCNNGY
jgi:hypothetical protein